jgi:tRNA-binding EMAP/Myf-like protein
MAESGEKEPEYAAALEVVNAFIEMARKHVDDDSLAIALVSTGAALMARSRGEPEAIDALRQAIAELRRAR